MTREAPTINELEAQSFRRQQIAFCVLTLFVLAVLLLLHTLFASSLGEPSSAVVIFLGVSFSLKVVEIAWLQSKTQGISERTAQIETAISIAGIFVLAALLAFLTDRDDSPYFVLLAIPILQCAYHLGLLPTIFTVVSAVSMIFAWNQHYFSIHPPPRATEYLEAGMISVIFCLLGPLIWYLVDQIKHKEIRLYEKMSELESTREKLVKEERLAAVGRFASGIAHEIRNPVAMIASSLATARYPGSDVAEREEMFTIAAREAKRLEKLTGEFLVYARPMKPKLVQVSIDEILDHIADVTRMRSMDREIEVRCEFCDENMADVDPVQVEGALLNLCLNAIDATPARGRIELRSRHEGNALLIEIENSGVPIPAADLNRVFEPFFTTKTGGTGLGLAIARGVATAHGGDLWVSTNKDGSVVFTMSIPSDVGGSDRKETVYGENPGS
jgi:signal transduction histidine kinase